MRFETFVVADRRSTDDDESAASLRIRIRLEVHHLALQLR